jgi:class 3 adenylate cyclase
MSPLLRGTRPSGVILATLAFLFGLTALVLFPLAPVQVLQLSAADMLFLWDGGPGLARRPAPPDILIVFTDEKTHSEIGATAWPPTLDEDLAVYRTLLAEGARAVADVQTLDLGRAGARQFLGTLASVDPDRRVIREVLLADQAPPPNGLGRLGRNPFHWEGAGLDALQRVRYYPLLVYWPSGEIDETMALKVARAALGLSPPDDLAGVARATGIAAAWARAANITPPWLSRAADEPRPYPLGVGRALPWVDQPYGRDNPIASAPLLVSSASLWLNYHWGPGAFASVSYVDVFRGRVPPAEIRGKVVVIGSPPLPGDAFPVPTAPARRMATAEIVATAVENILASDVMRPEPLPATVAGIWLLGVIGGVLFRRLRPLHAVGFSLAALTLYLAIANGLYQHAIFPDLVLGPGALLGAGLLSGGGRYAQEERIRRQIVDAFGRYVPRAVVDELVRHPHPGPTLHGVKREITVLFADVRGFTSFSERLPPEEVLTHLNALLQIAVDCIFQYGGTVDKYIGDAIMALFNAPLDQPDHPLRAVRAALAMQLAIAARGTSLSLGIGIHTGEAVVGNVGTPRRLEYTAIGSTVNLAARLCETAQAGEVIISDAVQARVKGLVVTEVRPPLRVKGIDRDLTTYRVSGDGIPNGARLIGRAPSYGA